MYIDTWLDRFQVRGWILALLVAMPCSQAARGQLLSSLGTSSADTSSGQTATLTGVVLNAITNQPISRALVRAGSQALLTEHDGAFQFTEASGYSEPIHVTKPGYYASLDSNASEKRLVFGSSTGPVKVYLYPEAIITGTITAPNGDPLERIYIQALRKAVDQPDSGWSVAGQTTSNSDGQFRLALSAGDYVIETHYMVDQPVRRFAILPLIVPDLSSGGQARGQAVIHLDSGTEQHLDLQPQLRATHEVNVRVDGASSQGFPQIEAHLSNGVSFFPTSRQGGAPGELIITLPSGTYTLTVSTGERDAGSYGQTSVTVSDSDVPGVVLHLTRSLPVPVELVIDSASGSSSGSTSDNQPPTVLQLGLRFVHTDQGPSSQSQPTYLRTGRGETPNFTFAPGRYRLVAEGQSQWYVESATLGGTDLLTQDLDVEIGGTSAPLRITVSNHTAGLKGTVRLDGNPANGCWIYLIATTPGATPVINAVSGSDGTFSRPTMPPGSYRVVAFETRHSADFSNPATLERLAPYMKTIAVAAGEIGNLDIDAIPTLELKH